MIRVTCAEHFKRLVRQKLTGEIMLWTETDQPNMFVALEIVLT